MAETIRYEPDLNRIDPGPAPCGCHLFAASLCDDALALWDQYLGTRWDDMRHETARAAYTDHLLAARDATRTVTQ